MNQVTAWFISASENLELGPPACFSLLAPEAAAEQEECIWESALTKLLARSGDV